jgi:hypothetical protein
MVPITDRHAGTKTTKKTEFPHHPGNQPFNARPRHPDGYIKGGYAPDSFRRPGKIIQRISRPHLSDELEEATDETTKYKVLSDRAFMCHRHYFDFVGAVFRRYCSGISSRQKGSRQLTDLRFQLSYEV